ncbi:MAG: Sir2 family NAD-dependent protein deacetylase [Roseiflexaceae bacterium]|nr:Sir2 family NAD-dependent protein deacetylase [Roseiflexaceae bacterium]
MEQDIARAAALLQAARRIVALTGAGISVPSGIPDFRSSSGLWVGQDPLAVASAQAFAADPQRFFRWIRPLIDQVLAAQPNPAHRTLAALEQRGQLRAVITQNIDSLHQQAGSREVFELHGHLRSASCATCGQQVAAAALIPRVRRGELPRCQCGGVYKPDIVLFGDALPLGLYWLAVEQLRQCDLLIVAGTSLEVAPVSELPQLALASGARLLVINKSTTHIDARADVVLRGDVADLLPRIVDYRL